MQRWAVMDSVHDGAWLRKAPLPDRSEQNVICLIANGETVFGDFVHVRRATGEAGFVRFRELEQQSGKTWRVNNASAALWKRPNGETDAANRACDINLGERVEGEFILVYRLDGKRCGYIKRSYLTALSPAGTHAPSSAKPSAVSARIAQAVQVVS